MGNLTGVRAMVTGASGGIGSAICRRLAADGASICATDLTQEGLDQIGQSLNLGPDRWVATAADLTQRVEVKKVVASGVEAFGGLNALVNVASASRNKPVMETNDEDLALALNTGIWATFYAMQECYPHLKQSGGSIVNFGSSAAITGQPRNGAYAAAKEAIRGLTRTATHEWGQDGIRINVVLPFAVTPMMKMWAEQHPDLYAKAAAGPALRRIGDPDEDIAPVVSWLLSRDSQYVTGQTIAVDGGSIVLP
jgi:NAD(P)-dependent dehydrogenase (short-subunit alcohol dehydrogenase family)